MLVGAACGDDASEATPTTTTTASTTTTVADELTDDADESAGGDADAGGDDPVDAETAVDASEPEPEPLAAPFPVTSSSRTLVDDSRPTPATALTEELLDRTIDVWIDAPTLDAAAPLVVFAHGLTGHPRSHEMLRTHLAEQGFIVVAPAFPLTNNDVEGSFANVFDVEGQVGDVSFVIDSMLADADLGPRIDPDKIGVIGHSLGGLTTAGVALNEDADDRISAAVVMSAGYGPVREGVAVLTVHGSADLVVRYESSVASYGFATGDRLFMTLDDGNHIEGILDDDSDVGVALRGVASAFFADAFDTDTGQIAALDGLPYERVTIEAGTAAGPLDDWRDYFPG